MSSKPILSLLIISSLLACGKSDHALTETNTYADVQIVGAMRNVMWQGELGGTIELDTISNKQGLYGLGPESYLTGEIMIADGSAYRSRVLTDSTMVVEETYQIAAPFLVYANVNNWQELSLPDSIKTISELERFLDEKTKGAKRPFAFKLSGFVEQADIHIQNLPPSTVVSSPAEAHQGQTNYQLVSESVDIVGFFSTEHQGVFTHHDSFLHMHLINKDRSKMGHLDDVILGKTQLYLPVY